MSSLVFPDNPVNGQIYPPESIPGVNRYRWEESSSTWRLIREGGSSFTLSVEENVGLDILGTPEDKILTTIYNSTVNDSEQSVPVGGAGPLPASEWKTKNLVEVLDTILFPELDPVYVIPGLSLSSSAQGIQEVGSSLAQTLSLTGTKNDSGIFTSLSISRDGSQLSSVSNPAGTSHTDLPAQFGFPNGNNPNRRYTLAYGDTILVKVGETSWSGLAAYQGGVALKTSKGETDTRAPQVRSPNAPQAASDISSNLITIQGIYPYFWGKSQTNLTASQIASIIQNGQANKVLSPSEGTIQATFDAQAEFVWFAHPSSSTSKTRWFFTELNQGEINSSSFILPPVTQNVSSPQGFWSNIPYKIYVSGYLSNTSGSLQLRNL
jgi:hypothetical protein